MFQYDVFSSTVSAARPDGASLFTEKFIIECSHPEVLVTRSPTSRRRAGAGKIPLGLEVDLAIDGKRCQFSEKGQRMASARIAISDRAGATNARHCADDRAKKAINTGFE